MKKSILFTEMQKNIIKLEQSLSYQFLDKSLALTAITHKSQKLSGSNLVHGTHNERLEFLGDAVLSLVSAEFFYKENEKFSEGELSRLRAQFVCQHHLSESAKRLNIKDFIRSDKTMRRSGANNSPSILSDTIEAIIGAVFIDGGLDKARDVVFKLLGKPSLILKQAVKDPKTELQEILQAKQKGRPHYELENSEGPRHAPYFEVSVRLDGVILAKGKGETKKAAAQMAAKEALKEFNEL